MLIMRWEGRAWCLKMELVVDRWVYVVSWGVCELLCTR